MPLTRKNQSAETFREVLPKTGMLYTEESSQMVLCKPKILPLKSVTLEKLEAMQKEAQQMLKLQDATIKTDLEEIVPNPTAHQQ